MKTENPHKRAGVLAALLLIASASAGRALSGAEIEIAGTLPYFDSPPFQVVQALNANASCCSLGIPASWPNASSTAHALWVKIAYLQPSVTDYDSGKQEINGSGTVQVFAGGTSIVPSGFEWVVDCATKVQETGEKAELTIQSGNAEKNTILSDSEYSGSQRAVVSDGESWQSAGPNSNQSSAAYSGLSPGEVNFTATYRVATYFKIVHYQYQSRIACNWGYCYRQVVCVPAATENKEFDDSVTDYSQAFVQTPVDSLNSSYFIDGSANRLRLNASGYDFWQAQGNGFLAQYNSEEYEYLQVLPPYNFTRIFAFSSPTFSLQGLNLIRGQIDQNATDVLFASPSNIQSPTFTVGTNFEQEQVHQRSDPISTTLQLNASTLANGTAAATVLLLDDSERPLSGLPVQVQWLNQTTTVVTGPLGTATVYAQTGSDSLVSAWFDSNGAYASSEASALSLTPASTSSGLEDFLALALGWLLVVIGLGAITGFDNKGLRQMAANAVFAGLVLWIVSKAV
jgi:hypothetical protein